MKVPEMQKPQQLFRTFCEGYKRRDLPLLLSLFTKQANMWGTGADEYRVGLSQIEEQLKRDWSQSEVGEIEIVSFAPSPLDALWTAAVCNAIITTQGNQYRFSDLRGTVIIEKEDGVWKISHMHASFPDYRNEEASSFPIKRENNHK